MSQKNKNGSVNILIDPPEKGSGLRSPKLEADIILKTRKADINKEIPKESFLIEGPGEYDVKEVYINGILLSPENTIYVIEAEDMRICHLGLLNAKGDLSSEQLEKIDGIDILMIPVGGGDSLDPKSAIKLMSQIEPKITIPMYYKIPKLAKKIETKDAFLKALGIKSLPTTSKLSVKRKDLSEEEAKIIILEP